MKKNHLLTALFICFCAISMQSQVKINNWGKIYVGTEWNGQDRGNVLSGSVFGPGDPWKGGSKLAFGDFGYYDNYGWNVFIGEYGHPDGRDDQLWLHGKNGYYITNGGKPGVPLMYNPSLLSNAVYFTTNIFSTGSFTNSDVRFKSNVTAIEAPLDKLLSLRGVTYDFNDKERKDALAKRQGEVISEHSDEPPSEKELQAMEEMKKWEELQLKKEHKTGFIAQEVQKVFPDLVKEDDLGYLAVDYVGIIPVIVEAMREQQNTINNQNKKIEELEIRLAQLEKTGNPKSSMPATVEEQEEAGEMKEDNSPSGSFLYQNNPNPFTEKTEIRYFLPTDSRNAQLYIFNMQGQNVKTVSLSGTRTGAIIIQGAELASGTYIYTLYSNGKELDTKRMILTK